MGMIKSKIKYYFAKILTLVRAKLPVGGMEVSDSTIRLVYFDGKDWVLGGVRLEPGVVQMGKVKNHDRFVEALKSVKLQVFGKKYEKRPINVVASLSSISIYSQVFSLPIIKGENLDKAIQLNIQMVSPVDAAHAVDGVIARAADDAIAPGGSVDRVGAAGADDDVRSRRAAGGVVAEHRGDELCRRHGVARRIRRRPRDDQIRRREGSHRPMAHKALSDNLLNVARK